MNKDDPRPRDEPGALLVTATTPPAPWYRRWWFFVAASTAAAAILLAGVYVLNSHRTGPESAQAPPSDADSIQQWWAAGPGEHVAELHEAFDGVKERAEELDEAGARNECERMHDAAAVDLQAHLPSPDAELTSELNAAIADTHTAAHMCMSALAGSPNSYVAEFLTYLDQADRHLRSAENIVDKQRPHA